MSDRPDSRGDQTGRLIEGCIDFARQCSDLLRDMPEDVFTSRGSGGSTIGAHARHILERFRCFFDGLDKGLIDYDDRQRGTLVERDVAAASAAFAELCERFANCPPSAFAERVAVRELVYHGGEQAVAASTPERELMGLITHGIHHLAMIAMIARAWDFPMPKDLGKAPSTVVADRENYPWDQVASGPASGSMRARNNS